MVAADWLTPFVIVSGDPTCTDLITQPELRRLLTNQQWGLVGVTVTSWYPTGALISDNQGCYLEILIHFLDRGTSIFFRNTIALKGVRIY